MSFALVALFFTWYGGQPLLPAGAEEIVGDIKLHDVRSAKGVLEATPIETPEFGLTRYRLVNRDRTEVITFMQHPGADRFSISQVRVQVAQTEESLPIYPGNPLSFQTGRGVRLGATQKDVVALLGTPSVMSKDGLLYRLTPARAREWLEFHKMPEYQAVYLFENDKLVEFEFGFPYP